jgi:hypothetical protein
MKNPYEKGIISRLTIMSTLLLSLWGCQTPVTYPSVVYDVPYCYDDPTKRQDKERCEDRSKDLYLNFDLLTKSPSVLWKDITGVLNDRSTQFWRLNLFRVSDGSYVTGTWEKDKKDTAWMSKTTRKIRFPEADLKYETMLSAHFEFCSNDTTMQCDDVSGKFETRYINFLIHDMTKEP